MPDIELRYAGRHIRRQFEKAVGKSILKILTELITNADDSYRRLEQDGAVDADSGQQAEIRVVMDRTTRTCRVIDQAEGLTADNMGYKFGTYGKDSGDRSHGFGTRSLFGKGLRDVLFTQKMGQVRSIKNGHTAICKFKWKVKDGEDVAVVSPNPGPKPSPELRIQWGIAQNGTAVEFRLSEGTQMPQHDTLVERLGNFYMLRKVTHNPRRVIKVVTITRSSKQEDIVRYSMPKGTKVANINKVLEFQGQQLPVTGDLYRFDTALQQGESGYETREGGLLVEDENGHVLDLTLFGYDTNPNAAPLFGSLKIQGAGDLIRRRLNADPPEELLTDTRDGLDRRSDFFKSLRELIDPILKPIVDQEATRQNASSVALPREVRRRHQQAMEKLNALYRKILGDESRPVPGQVGKHQVPPTNGLAFEHTSIMAKAGRLTPIALLINPSILPPGSKVEVHSESIYVDAMPPWFPVPDCDAGENVVSKVLKVAGSAPGHSGRVIARAGGLSAEINVTVVPDTVEVPDGMIFEPASLHLRPGQKRDLKLYIDVSKVEMGAVVTLDRVLDEGLSIDNPGIVVGAPNLDDTTYVRLISVTGSRLGARGSVTAQAGVYRTQATLEVVSRKQPEPNQGGFFTGYDFRNHGERSRSHPAYLNEDGLLEVNLDEPLNRRYLGATKDQAVGCVAEKSHAAIRLADVILDECLQKMVSEAYGSTLPYLTGDAPTDIRQYVLQQKAEIGPDIHALLVPDGLLTMHSARSQNEVAVTTAPSESG